MYLIDKISYVPYAKALQGFKLCHDPKAFSKENYVVGCQEETEKQNTCSAIAPVPAVYPGDFQNR